MKSDAGNLGKANKENIEAVMKPPVRSKTRRVLKLEALKIKVEKVKKPLGKLQMIAKWVEDLRQKSKSTRRSNLRKKTLLKCSLRKAEINLIRKQRKLAMKKAEEDARKAEEDRKIREAEDQRRVEESMDREWDEQMQLFDDFFSNLDSVKMPYS